MRLVVGVDNPFYGKKHFAETLEKIRNRSRYVIRKK
jgi:hypothetical protein